jgi:hypothetical protein
MAGADQYRAADFIAAIPGSGGIVTTIAKRVGCAWHTAKKYIDGYPTVKRIYDDECEGVLDLAEVKLIEAIKGGELAAIKYYLSTKGKGRGYTERVERRAENLNIDLSQCTNEQLERIANGEDPARVLATTGGGGAGAAEAD